MTPTAVIERASADGVTLALTPRGTIKATGQADAVKRWQPILLEHKPGIIAALLEAANNSGVHRHWSIVFPNLDPVQVIFAPEATRDEVAAIYPGAMIEPLPEPTPVAATAEQAAELRQLVAAILPDEAERAEALRVALADPEAALICRLGYLRTMRGNERYGGRNDD